MSRLISTNGDALPDTNIVVALWKSEPAVLAKMPGRRITTCSIVVGELFFGAYKSGRVLQNVERVEKYVASNIVLPCDAVTAKVCGQIKQALYAKGRPIPENDIWIAAVAMQHNLTLITRDHHFKEIWLEHRSVVT